MKKAPYSLPEAEKLCQEHQFLVGRTFASDSDAVIECVTVSPFDEQSRKRFLIYYFFSGLGAAAMQIFALYLGHGWDPNLPFAMLGASGAIFGLCGAILAVTLTGLLAKEGKRLILILFGPYVFINLLMGLTGGIDNAAHLGGLVSGAIVGLIIYTTMKPELNDDISTQ